MSERCPQRRRRDGMPCRKAAGHAGSHDYRQPAPRAPAICRWCGIAIEPEVGKPGPAAKFCSGLCRQKATRRSHAILRSHALADAEFLASAMTEMLSALDGAIAIAEAEQARLER